MGHVLKVLKSWCMWMLIVNMFGQILVAFESRKCWKHARFQLYVFVQLWGVCFQLLGRFFIFQFLGKFFAVFG